MISDEQIDAFLEAFVSDATVESDRVYFRELIAPIVASVRQTERERCGRVVVDHLRRLMTFTDSKQEKSCYEYAASELEQRILSDDKTT